MGLEQRGFQAVRIDKRTGGSMTFKETDLYNKGGQSAQNAGIQRLLNDAGIFPDVVDGYLGRESRAAINAFLAERKLPPTTTQAELIDILEDVAATAAPAGRHGCCATAPATASSPPSRAAARTAGNRAAGG